jgi:hypothetical protein
MDNQIPFGARNHIAIDRAVDLGGIRYLPGDTIVTDAATAESLLKDFYGELVSIEYDDNKVQYGACQQFRKLS